MNSIYKKLFDIFSGNISKMTALPAVNTNHSMALIVSLKDILPFSSIDSYWKLSLVIPSTATNKQISDCNMFKCSAFSLYLSIDKMKTDLVIIYRFFLGGGGRIVVQYTYILGFVVQSDYR